jgi:hypothetical protein
MLNTSLYLNISDFLASYNKTKCILKRPDVNLNYIILPEYQKKKINKFFINSFPIWISQFLSKYLICKLRCPNLYQKKILKKFITGYFNLNEINLFYTFYSTGLRLARIFNDKIMINILKDLLFHTFIEFIDEIIFVSNIDIKKFKILYDSIRDFDKMLIKCIVNPIFKIKKYYI